MNIIVEGPDNAGKTTLIKLLKERLVNFDYYHHNENNRDKYDINEVISLLCKENVIYDRHFLSEVAYSKALKRQGKLSIDDMALLFSLTKQNNCLIIICKGRWEKDRVEFSEGVYQELRLSYLFVEQMLTSVGINYIHYDWKTTDFEKLLNEIVKFLGATRC